MFVLLVKPEVLLLDHVHEAQALVFVLMMIDRSNTFESEVSQSISGSQTVTVNMKDHEKRSIRNHMILIYY